MPAQRKHSSSQAAAPWYEYGDPVGTSPPIFYFHCYPSSRYEGAFCHPLGVAHNLRIIYPDRPEPVSPQTAQHGHSPLPCRYPLPHNPPLDLPVPDLERQSRWSLLVTPLPAGRASPQPDVSAAQSSLPSTRSKYGKTGMRFVHQTVTLHILLGTRLPRLGHGLGALKYSTQSGP